MGESGVRVAAEELDTELRERIELLEATSGVTGEYPVMPCALGVAVRDVVRISGGVIQKASADTPTTATAIGFVKAKPSSVTAVVAYAGILGGFSGLTPDQPVWLSTTPGGVTQRPDLDLAGPQDVVQPLGVAKSSSEVVVLVDLSTFGQY